jgi:hypothetical protein
MLVSRGKRHMVKLVDRAANRHYVVSICFSRPNPATN